MCEFNALRGAEANFQRTLLQFFATIGEDEHYKKMSKFHGYLAHDIISVFTHSVIYTEFLFDNGTTSTTVSTHGIAYQ